MTHYYKLADLQEIAKHNAGGYFTGECVQVWTGLSVMLSGYPEVQSLSTENGLLVRPKGRTAYRIMVLNVRYYADGEWHTKEIRYNRYRPIDGGFPASGEDTVVPLRILDYLQGQGVGKPGEYDELRLFFKRFMGREYRLEDFRALMEVWWGCKYFDHHYWAIDGSSYSFHRDRHVRMMQMAKTNPVAKEMMLHHKVPVTEERK